MNNKGLSCSTVILLITITCQGCSHFENQVTKVKSALPGQNKGTDIIIAARTFESKNEWLAAREQYEKYLKKNPTSAKTCHRLGIVCTKSGDHIAATRYFTQGRQLEPNNSVLLNDFGFALYQRGQYQAAEKLFSTALQNDANNSRIINNLALAVGHQGRFKESFNQFRHIMPAAEAHANLAYIHTQRGEGDLALKEYDLALDADPNLEKAGLAAAELAAMKNELVARRKQKSAEGLADSKAAPETQPKKQTTQLVSMKQTARTNKKMSLNQSEPLRNKKNRVTQSSMQKQTKQQTINPFASEPKTENDALEINPFRSMDEITQEEEPVIIRISNEQAQKEAFPKTPRQVR